MTYCAASQLFRFHGVCRKGASLWPVFPFQPRSTKGVLLWVGSTSSLVGSSREDRSQERFSARLQSRVFLRSCSPALPVPELMVTWVLCSTSRLIPASTESLAPGTVLCISRAFVPIRP